MKKIAILLFILITSCISDKQISYSSRAEIPLLVNDSVTKFYEIDKQILSKVESETCFDNPVSNYFKENITKKTLKKADFKEWKRNIYLEFSLNQQNKIINLKTNASNNKLDKQLKEAFKKFDLTFFEFPEHDPHYKYTLVVIQPDNNGNPIVKCSEKLIGYAPPVFEYCKGQKTYKELNRCNYLYISNYINNSLELNLVSTKDLDHHHQILPKFIVDKNGKVVAAKIESQNKNLIENYFTTIKNLPKASKPARINGEPFYFGYTFPTSVSSLIRKSKEFRKYYEFNKEEGKDIAQNIREYIIEINEK